MNAIELCDAVANGKGQQLYDAIRAVVAEVVKPEPSRDTNSPDIPEWCISLAHRLRGSLGATTGVLARMIYEEFLRQTKPEPAAEDKDYDAMKGAFEYVCDKHGWDYVDGYEEYLENEKNKSDSKLTARVDAASGDAPDADKRAKRLRDIYFNARAGKHADWREAIWLWEQVRDADAATADLRKQLAERDAEIERLKTECANRKEIEDVLSKRIDEERSNVERLRRGPKNLCDVLIAVRALVRDSAAKGRASDIDIADIIPLISPLFYALNDENTRLRAELAEARKPVEDVNWNYLWSIPAQRHEADEMGMWLRRIFEPILQRERAARIEAERQRFVFRRPRPPNRPVALADTRDAWEHLPDL